MRQFDVVDIAAAAGDEAGILDPGHGLADAEFVHAWSQHEYHPSAAVGQGDLYLRFAAMRMERHAGTATKIAAAPVKSRRRHEKLAQTIDQADLRQGNSIDTRPL